MSDASLLRKVSHYSEMFCLLSVSICPVLKGSTSQGRCQSQKNPGPQPRIALRDHIRVRLYCCGSTCSQVAVLCLILIKRRSFTFPFALFCKSLTSSEKSWVCSNLFLPDNRAFFVCFFWSPLCLHPCCVVAWPPFKWIRELQVLLPSVLMWAWADCRAYCCVHTFWRQKKIDIPL